MITRTHSRDVYSFRDTAQTLPPCCSKYIKVHRGRLCLLKVQVRTLHEPLVYYYRAVGMYERTPCDHAHPSCFPLELISSGCFYYYSTHTHTHTSATWLVLDSSEMLRSLGMPGVSSPGGGVDAGRAAGGTSTTTVNQHHLLRRPQLLPNQRRWRHLRGLSYCWAVDGEKRGIVMFCFVKEMSPSSVETLTNKLQNNLKKPQICQDTKRCSSFNQSWVVSDNI